MKYFKVKIGYGDDDFISVGETELRKAISAQVSGKVAIFNEGTVSGNSIISILPDYNREMGYNRDYKLNGEDYARIGGDRQNEFQKILESVRSEIIGIAPISKHVNEASKLLGNKFKQLS